MSTQFTSVTQPEDVQRKRRRKSYRGKTFENCIVDLDGTEFIECSFRRSVVRYSGGELPAMVQCSFFETTFSVDQAAARTVKFLKAMSSPGSGLQAVVRETFGAIFGH